MIGSISRRQALGGAIGASVVLGGLIRGAHSADAATSATPLSGGCPDPVIPVVPGMTGDPRANQCWYELDQVGFYEPSQQFQEAAAAVGKALGSPDIETAMAELYVNTRLAGTYPRSFISVLAPVRDQLKVLSSTQISVFNEYYGCDARGLVSAMADFGQGILYDPRRPAGSKLHMMQGNPPEGYHAWHGYNRIFAFLGIDARYWDSFDPLVALGWAVQSTAKPVVDAHNPPLPVTTVRALTRHWLHMPPKRIDEAFMTFPYPPGIG